MAIDFLFDELRQELYPHPRWWRMPAFVSDSEQIDQDLTLRWGIPAQWQELAARFKTIATDLPADSRHKGILQRIDMHCLNFGKNLVWWNERSPESLAKVVRRTQWIFAKLGAFTAAAYRELSEYFASRGKTKRAQRAEALALEYRNIE